MSVFLYFSISQCVWPYATMTDICILVCVSVFGLMQRCQYFCILVLVSVFGLMQLCQYFCILVLVSVLTYATMSVFLYFSISQCVLHLLQ